MRIIRAMRVIGLVAVTALPVAGLVWVLGALAEMETPSYAIVGGYGDRSASVVSTTASITLYMPLVTYDLMVRLDPNDPYYVGGLQWALEKTRAPQAWYVTKGQAVTVAVIDTGVDLDHPDLTDSLVDGWDFVDGDALPQDEHGHGTHVAGIVAATTDNGVGVAAIGWGASVMPVRVLDSSGFGSVWDVAQGVRYAANNGARVINLSLGGSAGGVDLWEAIQYAQSQGVLVIAAAGNNGSSAPFYPAVYTDVIGVAATDSSDQRASFSNYGFYVDVAAPGEWIYSTKRDSGYGYGSGTSMAAPMVSGLAALIWTRYPTASCSTVSTAIMNGAQDLGSTGWDQYYGWGRINVQNSVSIVVNQPRGLPQAVDVPVATALPSAQFRPGEVIVSMRDVLNGRTTEGWTVLEANPRAGVYLIEVPPGQEALAAQALRGRSDVAYAHPNYVLGIARR